MRTENAANAAETGANKGKVPAFNWVTGITADQNVTGLPLHDKKGTAVLEVAGDSFTVEQFETADEVRNAAGEHLDSWILDAANRELRQAQIVARSAAARKLTLAPANIVDWVRSFTFDVASIFRPVERAERKATKKGVAAQLASVAANVDSMSADELRAFILAAAAQVAKK